jgi:hypothetical protein
MLVIGLFFLNAIYFAILDDSQWSNQVCMENRSRLCVTNAMSSGVMDYSHGLVLLDGVLW